MFIHRPLQRLLFVVLCSVLATGGAWGQDKQAPRKEPGPDAKGKVHSWQFEDGLVFEYYLPKDYDPEAPISLTFILHGSNLQHQWGFWNHEAGAFRGHDLVVCPDGTSSNGNGGFNFLQSRQDVERLHELHTKLIERFTVRDTYIYGHSQGSFFSLLYAGEYPDLVSGVVAHASGSWYGTRVSKKHHHQAIMHMHGSSDPVVPFGQSVASNDAYVENDYPHARLRVLQDYNHWPEQNQSGQALAWCEAMTTEDAQVAARNVDFLIEAGSWAGFSSDYGAIYQACARLVDWKEAPATTRKRAQKAMSSLQGQAEKHAAAIRKNLGKSKRDSTNGKPWSAHAAFFLREYAGVAACDEMEAEWSKLRESQAKIFAKQAKDYYAEREKDPALAAQAASEILTKCYLSLSLEDAHWRENLTAWLEDADEHGLKKKARKELQASLDQWIKSREQGRKSYLKIAKRL